MITLDEAKNHMRVDGDHDKNAIMAMIKTAKTHIENYTGVIYDRVALAPIGSAAPVGGRTVR